MINVNYRNQIDDSINQHTQFFILEEGNDFNLDYPELSFRKAKFYDYLIEQVHIFDNSLNGAYSFLAVRDASQSFTITLQANSSEYVGKTLRYYHTFAKLVKKNQYIQILYLLNLGLNTNFNTRDDFREHFQTILKALNLFNLDYFYDSTNNRIVRKLNNGVAASINLNLQELAHKESYANCVDEFLEPSGNLDKLKALENIKNVFQDILSEKGVKISEKSKVINLLTPGKNPNNLEFIIKNIHHSQLDRATGRVEKYRFTDNEFVYWWLEINNFIYLLTKESRVYV